ncbi:MAG: hypothetical protein WC635_13675 [Bacteriovorax sp.]|jgi:uncharacterized membrane protein
MKHLLALALFTSLSSLATASTPTLQCFGTEPFWGVSTNSKGLVTYDSPMTDGKRLYKNAKVLNAAGTADGYAFQVEARDAAENSIKISVVKTQCNDGMSDSIYTYTALVEVDESLLLGCCN